MATQPHEKPHSDSISPDRDAVGQRIRTARDSLPGQRDAMRPGTLSGVPTEPHGDENRDPPTNAPTPPP